jgi:uncharacterized protein (PEP-CTERM system associated)
MKIQNENDKCIRKSSNLAVRFGAVAAATVSLVGTRVEAAVEFHPRTTASATWIDNLTLAVDTDPAKKSGYVLQANPGFTWTQRGTRFNSSLDYTMQNVFFVDESDRNSTFHEGEALFDAAIIDDYFFLDGGADYSQQIVDPRLPTNNNNLFEVANQTDALAARLSPYFHHEFDSVLVDARYSRGIVDYKRTAGGRALQDADTQEYTGLLGSADEDARLTWEARYNHQQAEYDLSPVFRFAEARGELGLLLGRRVRLIGSGGKESDPSIDPTSAKLVNETWEGGLSWRPDDRTVLEGFYGERFYGESYRFRFRHDARRMRWILNYTESPMTEAQELLLRPVAADPSQQGAFAPDATGFARLTAEVFIRKIFEGTVSFTGRLTVIDLNVLDYRREYLSSSTLDDHTRGTGIGISRVLSSQTRLNLGGRIDETELNDGSEYRENMYRLELVRDLGQNVAVTLGGYRTKRSGNVSYTANWVTLAVTARY